jgi:hypothetical protein
MGFDFRSRYRMFRWINALDDEAFGVGKSLKQGVFNRLEPLIGVPCSKQSIWLIVTIAVMNFYIKFSGVVLAP